jgi:hypothetical protein
MRMSISIWALLFATTIAGFFVWARCPRSPDDIEAYLLPAAFLLLAAWGQIMRLQVMLEQHDQEALKATRKVSPNGGVSSFNRMFERKK